MYWVAVWVKVICIKHEGRVQHGPLPFHECVLTHLSTESKGSQPVHHNLCRGQLTLPPNNHNIIFIATS